MQSQKSKSSNTSNNTESKKKSSNANIIDMEKYRQNIEEVASKHLNVPEMIIPSVNNIIHPEDSVIYYPKNTHLISNKYPVYPLRLKEEVLKNFVEDTLFFMFFEQPNERAKELAKKELINRGWMYHTEFKSFFKLRGEPKDKNKDYIEGDFDCFDHEQEWKIKEIPNFKFMLKENNTK